MHKPFRIPDGFEGAGRDLAHHAQEERHTEGRGSGLLPVSQIRIARVQWRAFLKEKHPRIVKSDKQAGEWVGVDNYRVVTAVTDITGTVSIVLAPNGLPFWTFSHE